MLIQLLKFKEEFLEEKAAPGQFPFSVLIMNEGQHVGSGSILTLEWILTVRLRRFIETL